MKTTMIERFEAALNAMSDAEFQAMWEEVEQEGNEGPTADALVASFAFSATAPQPTVHFSGSGLDLYAGAGAYNFAMAA